MANDSVTLVVPELNPTISFHSTKPGKSGNKATVKKMVVADPGLGMEVVLEALENIASFSISFKLGQAEGVYHHQVNFANGAHINTEDPTKTSMDLSVPFIFAVPFIDTNYTNEVGNNVTPGPTLYYSITVQYFKLDEEAKLYLYSSFNHTDSIQHDSIQAVNKKFKGYLNGSPIIGILQNNPQTDGNPMKYENVLFHKLGAAFQIEFPTDAKNIQSSSTYLYKNSYNMPTNYSIAALMGKFKVDNNGFCWMPHTQAPGEFTSETHISIQPWDDPHTHSNVSNLNFYPASPFAASDGEVEIKLE